MKVQTSQGMAPFAIYPVILASQTMELQHCRRHLQTSQTRHIAEETTPFRYLSRRHRHQHYRCHLQPLLSLDIVASRRLFRSTLSIPAFALAVIVTSIMAVIFKRRLVHLTVAIVVIVASRRLVDLSYCHCCCHRR